MARAFDQPGLDGAASRHADLTERSIGMARSGLMIEALFCVLAGGALSVHFGMDGNWDLQNYHLYNAFAFLDGRLDTDFLAADIQSYFNPLLDLPFLIALRALPKAPQVVCFLAGIPYGLLLLIGLRLGKALALRLGASPWEGRAAALLGLTGTALLSEVGTTFGDVPIAVLALAGLWLELSAMRPPRAAARGWPLGLLLGLAAGLKLTSMIFAPAGLLALLLGARGRGQALRLALWFCTAWLLGFLAIAGWWGWLLDTRFGNPIFPMYNNLFRSPWFPPIAFRDTGFLPRDAWQALFYPFYWISGTPHLVTEVPIRDARFACAYLALGGLGLIGLAGRVRRRSPVRPVLADPGSRLVIGFFVISFVLWEAAFSILRYIVALEALTGLVIWLGIAALTGLLVKSRLATALRWAALAGLAALLAWTSVPLDWGRLPQGRSIAEMSGPAMPEGGTVLLFGPPIGFVTVFLQAPDAAFYHLGYLASNPPAIAKLRHRLAEGGPVALVTNQAPDAWVGRIAEFGLAPDASGCEPIVNTRQPAITLCRLTRFHD